MSGYFRAYASVFIGTTCLIAASACMAAPQPKALADTFYFPTTVGQKLMYRKQDKVISETVVAVKKIDQTITVNTKIELEGEKNCTRTIEIKPDGVYEISRDGSTLETPVCLLTLPIVPKASIETVTKGPGGLDMKISRIFGSPAPVKVEAGNFEAIQIDRKVYFGKSIVPAYQLTEWYAPGVGLVKRQEGEIREELIKLESPIK